MSIKTNYTFGNKQVTEHTVHVIAKSNDFYASNVLMTPQGLIFVTPAPYKTNYLISLEGVDNQGTSFQAYNYLMQTFEKYMAQVEDKERVYDLEKTLIAIPNVKLKIKKIELDVPEKSIEGKVINLGDIQYRSNGEAVRILWKDGKSSVTSPQVKGLVNKNTTEEEFTGFTLHFIKCVLLIKEVMKTPIEITGLAKIGAIKLIHERKHANSLSQNSRKALIEVDGKILSYYCMRLEYNTLYVGLVNDNSEVSVLNIKTKERGVKALYETLMVHLAGLLKTTPVEIEPSDYEVSFSDTTAPMKPDTKDNRLRSVVVDGKEIVFTRVTPVNDGLVLSLPVSIKETAFYYLYNGNGYSERDIIKEVNPKLIVRNGLAVPREDVLFIREPKHLSGLTINELGVIQLGNIDQYKLLGGKPIKLVKTEVLERYGLPKDRYHFASDMFQPVNYMPDPNEGKPYTKKLAKGNMIDVDYATNSKGEQLTIVKTDIPKTPKPEVTEESQEKKKKGFFGSVFDAFKGRIN